MVVRGSITFVRLLKRTAARRVRRKFQNREFIPFRKYRSRVTAYWNPGIGICPANCNHKHDTFVPCKTLNTRALPRCNFWYRFPRVEADHGRKNSNNRSLGRFESRWRRAPGLAAFCIPLSKRIVALRRYSSLHTGLLHIGPRHKRETFHLCSMPSDFRLHKERWAAIPRALRNGRKPRRVRHRCICNCRCIRTLQSARRGNWFPRRNNKPFGQGHRNYWERKSRLIGF